MLLFNLFERDCRKLKEKEEKRKLRKLAKKEGADFEHTDSVKFGEVVQQPPSLTAKPRVKVGHPCVHVHLSGAPAHNVTDCRVHEYRNRRQRWWPMR